MINYEINDKTKNKINKTLQIIDNFNTEPGKI